MAKTKIDMVNISEINDLMDDIKCATMALYAARVLPDLDTRSMEAFDLISCGLDDTNNIHVGMEILEDIDIIISASFSLDEDEIKCQLEVMDDVENEIGIFDIPELKAFLAHHPSLQYNNNPENPDLNSYIDKDVPPTQIVGAFLATLMAVQVFSFQNS